MKGFAFKFLELAEVALSLLAEVAPIVLKLAEVAPNVLELTEV